MADAVAVVRSLARADLRVVDCCNNWCGCSSLEDGLLSLGELLSDVTMDALEDC